uniref:Macaca fascicularis brain cDNA clone: QorA-14046, similar to human protocadherin 9 (PCDH9), transcript variant 2, mRNA, RefSeq: NM_020403.3 n=1 Tax=Macaca fascicularis TaxID=9541 RepID=I7GHM9_MACFA|nr:unnamed protein product [Macaca fascicularis]
MHASSSNLCIIPQWKPLNPKIQEKKINTLSWT